MISGSPCRKYHGCALGSHLSIAGKNQAVPTLARFLAAAGFWGTTLCSRRWMRSAPSLGSSTAKEQPLADSGPAGPLGRAWPWSPGRTLLCISSQGFGHIKNLHPHRSVTQCQDTRVEVQDFSAPHPILLEQQTQFYCSFLNYYLIF